MKNRGKVKKKKKNLIYLLSKNVAEELGDTFQLTHQAASVTRVAGAKGTSVWARLVPTPRR